MKIAVGLNDKGKKAAEAFLLKYDKRSGEPQYNMTIAVAEIERKALESENYHYELRGFDTATGNPVTIDFEDSELVWQEVEE